MSDFKKINSILNENSYVGRGIIAGLTSDGSSIFLGYMLSGRSENSKNRVLVKKNNELITSVFDESKVQDPSLIIYTALKRLNNLLILTNGDQTDTIYEKLSNGIPFEQSLDKREYEPDAPIFTPRISLLVDFDANNYKMSILLNGNVETGVCDRHFFSYTFDKGRGHFIHTYNTKADKLDVFNTLPETIEIEDDFENFSNKIWDNMNPQNKIALYTYTTNIKSGFSKEKLFNIHWIWS